ncbi:pyridoxal-dependent decarboxylase [Desulfopila sp. IMCC35008]|uniref:pyridoxal phosphate-dependent decarboxylase family protein n=1 Tax=Desulfopila sp. IMCC35008 TaxID=2653858 RepID=UPI0013D4450D|nr:pyridoxal-dependent decarboxylase [Desulfopila sp. IMCC35008]
MGKTTLDPEDWGAFRSSAHKMLDDALDKMESARDGRVWNPLPEKMKAALQSEIPKQGLGIDELRQKLADLLPYGVGNTHPRFFGWVHGAGNPGGILAEMTAAAMNANLGGRDHGAIYVEKQVVEWCRQMMGFPAGASGLIVSGTSMATIIALKVARDQRFNFTCRQEGLSGRRLVGYASSQSHSCLGRAFDLLGLGAAALRRIECDHNFRMDTAELEETITRDRARGLVPFVIVGTAGSVNVGAIDDLQTINMIAEREDLWLHVDGAFGATAVLSKDLKGRLAGLEQADSLAFDFHKWLHVNYDAGCILVRSGESHLRSFSGRPEYLAGEGQGLAAGSPWPVDFGPELSRGFRALKVWAHLLEHGVEKLGRAINENCVQAAYLAEKITASSLFELAAPVTLNIVCFRYVSESVNDQDELNRSIVINLQNKGIAAPSTTILRGKLAIRVNITNHRTECGDLDLFFEETAKIAVELERAASSNGV